MTRLLLIAGALIAAGLLLLLTLAQPTHPGEQRGTGMKPTTVLSTTRASGSLPVTAMTSATSASTAVLIRAPNENPTAEVVLLAAAGLKNVIEAQMRAFTTETGEPVRQQFGGSGQLQGQLEIGAPGDVFIAADPSYIDACVRKGLVREVVPMARQRAVIAVKNGNPLGITSLADLLSKGVKYGLPNPESASLGRTLKTRLGAGWAPLLAGAAVTKPTVSEVFADLRLGSVDAALLWDANVAQAKDYSIVAAPELADLTEVITAGVTTKAQYPAAALRAVRWLASPEHGAEVWRRFGYEPVAGDRWQVRPTLRLYSGSVNRKAVEQILREFVAREGVDVDTVFNGCGILCADIKIAQQSAAIIPDMYYACDICFVQPVADLFPEAVILTETDIGIAVPKGNPKQIRSLADLARPGLVVGLCNAEQSTLGYMTGKMLDKLGLSKAVMATARAQVPTADLLITQLRLGALDAAVVYKVNVVSIGDYLDFIVINQPGAKAVQPFSVWKDSAHRQVARRLLDTIKANSARFEAAGFRWRGNEPVRDSRTFSIDPTANDRP